MKGTDGMAERAVALGAEPIAHMRAEMALREIRRRLDAETGLPVHWLTCSGAMGGNTLQKLGFHDFDEVYAPPAETSGSDTELAVRRFVDAAAELILFCGGDGTARDVCSVTGADTPILGIPAGVKMHSAVFGASPTRTGEILVAWLRGSLELATADVVDVDEARYREGDWVVRLYCVARVPFEPTFTQAAKLMVVEQLDEDTRADIAEYLRDDLAADGDRLILLGPGSTVDSIARALGVEKTLLGIDAVVGGKLVGQDLSERGLLALLERYPRRLLILSPIGAQGFVLGRGNLQLSPEVVRRIGRRNIVVAATPGKLARTPALRFDTGDRTLDAELAEGGYVPVVIGDRRRRMVKVVL